MENTVNEPLLGTRQRVLTGSPSPAAVPNHARPRRRSSLFETILAMRRNSVPLRNEDPFMWLLHTIWRYCLEIGVCIQAFGTFVCTVFSQANADSNVPVGILIPLIVLQCFQLIVLIISLMYTFSRMRTQFPATKRIWQTYLAITLAFAGFYFTVIVASNGSFKVFGFRDTHDAAHAKTESFFGLLVSSIYFSTATMSSTGFGDIVATSPLSQCLAALQMALGILYSIGIFAVAYSHFQDTSPAAAEASTSRTRRRNVAQRLFKYLRSNVVGVERLRRFVIRWILLISISITFSGFMLLWWQGRNGNAQTKVVLLIILAIIQVIFTLFLLGISVRLVRKMSVNHLTMHFLVQSYFSTSILFGNLYLGLFLADNHSFHIEDRQGAQLNEDSGGGLAELVWRFNYFAFATMTTTGFGDLYAAMSVSRVLVTIQMLVSTFYHIAVVGLGLNRLSSSWGWDHQMQ